MIQCLLTYGARFDFATPNDKLPASKETTQDQTISLFSLPI